MPQVVIPDKTLSLIGTLSHYVTVVAYTPAFFLCMSLCVCLSVGARALVYVSLCVCACLCVHKTHPKKRQYVYDFNTIHRRLSYSIWHSCWLWTQTCIPHDATHTCRPLLPGRSSACCTLELRPRMHFGILPKFHTPCCISGGDPHCVHIATHTHKHMIHKNMMCLMCVP